MIWTQKIVKILLKFDNIIAISTASPQARAAVRTADLRAGSQPRCREPHHHSFRSSFSAGSTPIFASKYAFCSIFQNLQEYHLLASKFKKCRQIFCKISQNVARTLRTYWKLKKANIPKLFRTLYRIFQTLVN